MEQVTDHAARALAHLRSQFQGKPKIAALLSGLMGMVQDLEDAIWTVYIGRFLDNAVGVTLDTIGKIVGQLRAGLGDDDFRRFIRARIATNRSNGLPEEMLNIARLVLDDEDARIILTRYQPAAMVFRVVDMTIDDALAEILLGFLKDGAAGGVRVQLEYIPFDDLESFRWDGDEVGEGFGDTSDPDVGGKLISVIE